MSVPASLSGVAALLVMAVLGAVLATIAPRRRLATGVVYGACLLIAAGLLATAAAALIGGDGAVAALTLPLGIPWIGSPFRTARLSSSFLATLNLHPPPASLDSPPTRRPDPTP